MRIAWVVPNADINVASFRYRCLVPAWALQRRGHENTIFVDERPDPAQFDALIAMKQADHRLVTVARSFKAQDKPVYLDLCDNIFVPGYAQRRGPDLSPETALELMRHAVGFVTPTEALARVLRSQVDGDVGSWVVPDAAITPGLYQATAAWLSDTMVPERPSGMERLITGSRRVFGKAGEGSGAAVNGNNKHDSESFDAESDWGVDHLPVDTARVIWFGRHGSYHSEFGMDLLKPVIEELERTHRDRPIELVVISNNRTRFDALTYGVKIFSRYEDWSNERVFFELSRANLFVMPSAADPFSLCKSANRAVLALANGVPVTASYLEALEPLRDVLVLDDWRAGINGYLLDPAMTSRHLAGAQSVLADQFSADAIARFWEEALCHPARRTANPAGSSTARQEARAQSA